MVLDLYINFEKIKLFSKNVVFAFEDSESGHLLKILESQELVIIVDNLFFYLKTKNLLIKLQKSSKLTIIERNNFVLNENLVVEQAESSQFVYQKLYESSGKSCLSINQIGNNCITKIQNIIFGNNIELDINQKVLQFKRKQNLEHKTKFVLDGNSNLKVSHFGKSTMMSDYCEIDQKIKGIILDSNSKVEIQPILEIDSDSSTSNHGASVGTFDNDEILYLQSRGLDDLESQNLLTNSFLNDFWENIEPVCVRERWKIGK